MNNLTEIVRGALLRYQDLVITRLGRDVTIPPVKYRLRGSAAGSYCLVSTVIDFNRRLLINNVEAFVSDTIPHEFAHHVVDQVYGRVNFTHGREWQYVMKVMGVKPRITHSLVVN